jgi:hypothetical protein
LPSMNTPASTEGDASHWRRCAEETRRAANQAVNSIERSTLIEAGHSCRIKARVVSPP